MRTQDTLIVGETGQMIADITAGTVICKGKVEGTILAHQRMEIHSHSQVVGTVRTPQLFVELGGILDGQCDMAGQGNNKIVKLVKDAENDVPAAAVRKTGSADQVK